MLFIQQGLRVGHQERIRQQARGKARSPGGNSGEAGQGTGLHVLGIPGLAEDTDAGHPFSWDPTTNPLATGGQEHLDYVLHRRGHVRPRVWTNTVLTPTSPTWEYAGTSYTDYSDHYPVAGS